MGGRCSMVMRRNAEKRCIVFHFQRDFNEDEPWIISFKTQGVEMQKLSFSKQ